jgi:hypothetical protein
LRPGAAWPYSTKLPMHPKLATLQRVIAKAILGMTANELTFSSPGKWSSAEILDHLNLTYIGTIKNLERCLAAGEPRASSDRRCMRWQRIVVTRLGYFPAGRKSPERVLPCGTPPQQITSEIMENLVRMDGAIRECETRFGAGKPVADHPVLGPLTSAEWRGFHLAHGKHHAKQILRRRKKTLTV